MYKCGDYIPCVYICICTRVVTIYRVYIYIYVHVWWLFLAFSTRTPPIVLSAQGVRQLGTFIELRDNLIGKLGNFSLSSMII